MCLKKGNAENLEAAPDKLLPRPLGCILDIEDSTFFFLFILFINTDSAASGPAAQPPSVLNADSLHC